MARKCFISFKTEDLAYRDSILEIPELDIIDKSLHEAIDSSDEEYIMRRIREDYLADSTVTLFLIGKKSAENVLFENQTFIKRELQASLYNGQYNTRNGILGIVLPNMYESVYLGVRYCMICGGAHNNLSINDTTVIKEFSYNYFIPNEKCYWAEDDRYCVLVKWDDFIANPVKYIELAFEKRSQEIASMVTVRPK